MNDIPFLIDEGYLFFEHLTTEARKRIAQHLTKMRFMAGRRKFHIYEIREGKYVDTGRVENFTYEEYMEWHRANDKPTE